MTVDKIFNQLKNSMVSLEIEQDIMAIRVSDELTSMRDFKKEIQNFLNLMQNKQQGIFN